jgi:hypothetical protein
MSSSDGLLIERRTSAAVSFVGLFFNSSPLQGGTLSENKMTCRLTDWHATHKTKREVSPAGILFFIFGQRARDALQSEAVADSDAEHLADVHTAKWRPSSVIGSRYR